MIGVIPKPEQVAAVEEFFELFKTPWELYRAGRSYDAVIVTTDKIPAVEATLLLVYGSAGKELDARQRISAGRLVRGAVLETGRHRIPIYRDLLTFSDCGHGVPCARTGSQVAGVRVDHQDTTIVRFGFDLFEEVRALLTEGQPAEHAATPSLDLHIALVREWILASGSPLVEIPPRPAGHDFVVCLTHDIDFVGIRRHFLDHSMWGFVLRATVGSVRNFFRGRLSLHQVWSCWRAAASLPLVFAGWMKDFWEPFDWYLAVEKSLPSTYFLIPFKHRAGDGVPGRHASRRASAYDVSDLPGQIATLQAAGCELGVHGIDAWHSPEKGREELAALTKASGQSRTGIRMHWLLQDAHTPAVLEKAGYAYDSSCGYNETVGYRAGTTQVFRPLDAKALLELPMHIQDGALFYPQRLDLSDEAAEKRWHELANNSIALGGVLTVLWHDRSHAPERFWGDFYKKMVAQLKAMDAWFATGSEVVNWFDQRRQVSFDCASESDQRLVRLRYQGSKLEQSLRVRVHEAEKGTTAFRDIPWDGKSGSLEIRLAEDQPVAPEGVVCQPS